MRYDLITMMSHFSRGVDNRKSGFVLPTVFIVSLVMLALLASAMQIMAASSAGLRNRYYNQLAREAAEAGIERAKDCKERGLLVVSDTARLRPDTTCSGGLMPAASKYVLDNGIIQSSFEVSGNNSQYTSTGVINLLRSDGLVSKTFRASVSGSGDYLSRPFVSAGSGVGTQGHFAVILATNRQIYGFGSNSYKQITDSAVPTNVTTPIRMALPVGVNYVKKVKVVGWQSRAVCIIGDNDGLYCRGESVSLFKPNSGANQGSGWLRFGPATMKVQQIAVNSYGKSGYPRDSVCAVTATGDVYCAGANYYGNFGNQVANDMGTEYPMSSPAKFLLPSPQKAKKVFNQGPQICVLTTTDSLYCSGRSDWGQVSRNGAYIISTPVLYSLPSIDAGNGTGPPRKVVDLLPLYFGGVNGGLALHALADDGSVWSTGLAYSAEFGNGWGPFPASNIDTRATGPVWWSRKGGSILTLDSAPVWIDGYGSTYWCLDTPGGQGGAIIQHHCRTGLAAGQDWFVADGPSGAIYNPGSNMCIDVPNNDARPGVKLINFPCNNTDAQRWVRDGMAIKHKASGLCMDVYGGYTGDFNPIQLWTCHGQQSQRFNTWDYAKPYKSIMVTRDSFCAVRVSMWYGGMQCGGANMHGQLLNNGGEIGGEVIVTPAGPGGYLPSYQGIALPSGEAVKLNIDEEWQYQMDTAQVITQSGRVVGSGQNTYGKLGNGKTAPSHYTLNYFQLPAGVKAIDMATRDEFTTYVVGDNGKIYAAGLNANGQLGNGTTTNSSIPVEVKLPQEAYESLF